MIIWMSSNEGTAPILTYMYAKELHIVVCQIIGLKPFISRKKKGNHHKQDLLLSQEKLVQLAKLSFADMALFG